MMKRFVALALMAFSLAACGDRFPDYHYKMTLSFGPKLSTQEIEEELHSHIMVGENWDAGDDEMSVLSVLYKYISAFADVDNRFAKYLAWLPADGPLAPDPNDDDIVSSRTGAVCWDSGSWDERYSGLEQQRLNVNWCVGDTREAG